MASVHFWGANAVNGVINNHHQEREDTMSDVSTSFARGSASTTFFSVALATNLFYRAYVTSSTARAWWIPKEQDSGRLACSAWWRRLDGTVPENN